MSLLPHSVFQDHHKVPSRFKGRRWRLHLLKKGMSKNLQTRFKTTTTSVFRWPTGTQYSSFPISNSQSILLLQVSPQYLLSPTCPQDLTSSSPGHPTIGQLFHPSPSWFCRHSHLSHTYKCYIIRTHWGSVMDFGSNTTCACSLWSIGSCDNCYLQTTNSGENSSVLVHNWVGVIY